VFLPTSGQKNKPLFSHLSNLGNEHFKGLRIFPRSPSPIAATRARVSLYPYHSFLSSADSFTVKIEAAFSSEISINIYQITAQETIFFIVTAMRTST
jgi:hypothetical protein